MGTYYVIKIVDPFQHNYTPFIVQNKIDSLLEKINKHLSTYLEKSEINRFNEYDDIEPFSASDDFIEIVNKSIYMHDISNGAFDITVQSLYNEWGFDSYDLKETIPDSSAILDILEYTGTEKIEIIEKMIVKKDPTVQLDVSAIAKGWAVDKISILLENIGLTNYLIDIGGEVKVSGNNKAGNPWKIGIRSPEEELLDIHSNINITNLAIATSGTYLNYFTIDDMNFSHLIDPVSGFPIQHELISATIVAKDCATADAVATAVMVKGMEEGMRWIESLSFVEGMLIVKTIHGEYLQKKSERFIFD